MTVLFDTLSKLSLFALLNWSNNTKLPELGLVNLYKKDLFGVGVGGSFNKKGL